MIGSEKLPYFQDPAVIQTFHDNGYYVQVDTAGSRQIATAGMAKDNGTYITFDIKAFLAAVAKNTRWSDLPGSTTYPATKSILITSTDVRTSNSAAMYLSLASYVANGNNVIQDATQATAVLPAVQPIFLRQGR